MLLYEYLCLKNQLCFVYQNGEGEMCFSSFGHHNLWLFNELNAHSVIWFFCTAKAKTL